MSNIEQAKQLIADGAFERLDDLWTDLVTDDSIELEQYLGIIDALKVKGKIEQASLLLELLGEHYEARDRLKCAIEVQKSLLRFHEEHPRIRKKLIDLYRRQYLKSEHLDDYLRQSGFDSDEPIMKAIHRLEEYLKYDIGKFFFFERYGLGKVVAVVPEKREIVLDFEKKDRHFLSIDVARGLLKPVDRNHFLFLKHAEVEKLRKLAEEKPEEIVVMLLHSIREPMPASKIKGFLQGIIEQTRLNRFWEKTRKILEKHDNIRIAGKTSKTYSYVDTIADKEDQAIKAFHKAKWEDRYGIAEEYVDKMPDIFNVLIPDLTKLGRQSLKDHPGIALDILMLLQNRKPDAELAYSIDDLLESHKPADILQEITNPKHRGSFLEYVKVKAPDRWQTTAAEIFFGSDDFRIMDAVADHLSDVPQKMEETYQRILAMPRAYPKQFHWMLKKIESGALQDHLKPNLIPRILDCTNYVPGVTAIVKRILALKNFDLIISGAEEGDAERIHDSIRTSNTLTDHEISGYLRILEHHFPNLAEEASDVIYATEVALARKKRELEHILSVEIPANKKEISSAREFGDLSENFEYKAAKEKQDQLYAKVKNIESELLNTRIIDPHKINIDKVNVGAVVKLQSTEDDSIVHYTIMGRWDTDLSHNIISNEAPLAQILMGRKCGERVKIDRTEYTIIKISPAL
ncbi:MAG: GreA/GreB family elongation factor [candidate division WOR-3 bacterium]|nr:MAG: GreA/GreB family elongation factor [candidate division WOR-3 bacterium]